MRRALVVGGGYAGCAAAVELADLGFEVTLLEARRQWGGRATSWPDPRLGDPVDNGQHIWLGCYRETRRLLARLGSAHRVEFAPVLDLLWLELGGRRSRLRAGPGRVGLALGLLGLTRVPLAERVRLGRALAAGEAPPAGATVARWLEVLGQGPSARRFFWQPFCEAALNETPDRAAALPLYRALVEAFRGSAEDAALGLPRAGLADLLAPIVDCLAARGGRALLGRAAREVRAAPDGGYETVLESGESLGSEALVLALPAADAQALAAAGALSDVAAALEPAARTALSPIVSVTLWFDRPVLPARVVGLVSPPAGGGPGFSFAFDRGALVGGTPGRWPLTLVASAARSIVGLPARGVVERARAALDAYGVTTAAPLAERVIKEPRATPSLTPEAERARPACATRRLGLAVAGDWTATGLPATLEGAVRSGRAAARAAAGLPGEESVLSA